MNFLLQPLAQKTITPGTPIQLDGITAGRNKVRSVVIEWVTGNTGVVYVGASDVTSTKCLQIDTNLRVITIEVPGAIHPDQYIDLSKIWIDGSVNGDKVNIAYLETTG